MILENKVAVITGAGSGIGLAMARLFVAEGARVVAADVVAERLQQFEGVAGIDTVVADVSKSEDVSRMIDLAVERHGKLDILCNNAGISDRLLMVADLTDEDWDRVLAVNLTGTFLACRRAIPIMIDGGGGVIINTASVAGLRGGRSGAAYTASKHGVIGLTKSIAAAYGRGGIRCVAFCPDKTDTRINEGHTWSQRGKEVIDRSIPARLRACSPEEQASVALFLASDAARFVNGAIIPVDGGDLAH
ncbi:MAG: SDR family oxidoreductase [Chloroflexi bacterium]|nr:SDR family oxidoreductase [Chloroflexota bacterium]